MLNLISNLLQSSNISEFGICNFEEIHPYLLHCRAESLIPKNAQSIITMLFPYYIPCTDLNISRYAAVPDYHHICGGIINEISKRLRSVFKQFDFVPFIDNSPIPEIRCAILCGLGRLGDNGLLINKTYGSWVFIGEIVTNMKLNATSHYSECLHCGKCTKSCPGDALPCSKFDKSLCLSHISQKKGNLTEKEIYLLQKGHYIWGCDICQDCCPMNHDISVSNIFIKDVDFIPNIQKGDYSILKNRAFHWRPESVINRNLSILNQN